jgi:hypothetical protein
MRWIHGSGADQSKEKFSLLCHRRSSALPIQESVAGIHVRCDLSRELPRALRTVDFLLFFTYLPLLELQPAPAHSGGRHCIYQ